MIDEHKEELAAMYALGAMEPREAHAFEAEMRADPELLKFVDDLLHSSAAMVHACPLKSAPLHLKEKVLSEIRFHKTPERVAEKSGAETNVVPFHRPFAWLPWAIAASLLVACGWLYADRAKLKKQLDAALGRSDVCEMQLALLNPTSDKAQGVATIIWDSTTQTGVIEGQDMPRPAANQDYQLWVLDDQYPQPVDAGVFSVDENGRTKATMFKPKQKVSATDKFAISLEKKGGMPQPEGPIVMAGGKK
jgi:anti-sigma-K factor RskA